MLHVIKVVGEFFQSCQHGHRHIWHVHYLNMSGVNARLLAYESRHRATRIRKTFTALADIRGLRPNAVILPDPVLFVLGSIWARLNGVRAVIDIHEDYRNSVASRSWIPIGLRGSIGRSPQRQTDSSLPRRSWPLRNLRRHTLSSFLTSPIRPLSPQEARNSLHAGNLHRECDSGDGRPGTCRPCETKSRYEVSCNRSGSVPPRDSDAGQSRVSGCFPR